MPSLFDVIGGTALAHYLSDGGPDPVGAGCGPLFYFLLFGGGPCGPLVGSARDY